MNFRGTRERLVASLRRIPAVLRGDHPDALGLRAVFFGTVGNTVLRLLSEDYQSRLDGGAARDGSTWKPLAEATLERRRRKGRDDEQILIESRRLLESLKPALVDGISTNPDLTSELTGGGLTLTCTVPWASIHQDGTAHVPKREFMPQGDFPEAWVPDVERAFEEAMAQVVNLIVAAGGFD